MVNRTEFGARLYKLRKARGWGQQFVADAVKMSQSNYAGLEKSGVDSSFTPKLAELFGVEVNHLAYGHPSLDEPESLDGLTVIGNPKTKKRGGDVVINQFDTGGAMGDGLVLRDQPGMIQSWRVTPEWVDKNIKDHTGVGNLCIVTGFGDSMRGMFNSGDPLIVDRGIKSVEYDAVYFFRVDDEGFIKRLQRVPGEGIRVLSENKKYETWTIKPGMDFEIFGRVLRAWQGENY